MWRLGEDAFETDLVLVILLAQAALQVAQLPCDHRPQRRVQLQHFGKVGLSFGRIPNSCVGLGSLEVGLDVVCGDSKS